MERRLHTDQGESLRLSTAREGRLGVGGQGEVFTASLNGNRVAVKLLRQVEEPRLQALRRLEPICGRIATLPMRLLYEAGSPVGYAMRWIDPDTSLSAIRLFDFNAIRRLRRFTWKDAVLAALRLAESVAALHRCGVVIGDLNSENVLFEQQGRAWRAVLLDTDSFQIAGEHGRPFLCPVGRPPTTPPELVGADLSTTVRSPSADAFALAVLIHQILLHDHPYDNALYASEPELPVSERIARGLYPHAAVAVPGLSASPCRPAPHQISDAIDDAFRRSFHPSRHHLCPGIRPTAAAWVSLLRELHGALVPCRSNPHHHHPRGRACLWCSLDQAVGQPISQFPTGSADTIHRGRQPGVPSPEASPSPPLPPWSEPLRAHLNRCRRLQPLHGQLVDRLLRHARRADAVRSRHGDPSQLFDAQVQQKRIEARDGWWRRLVPGEGRQGARHASLHDLRTTASSIAAGITAELQRQAVLRRDLLDALAALDTAALDAAADAPARQKQLLIAQVDQWIEEQLRMIPIRSWAMEGFGEGRLAVLEAHELGMADQLRRGLDRVRELPGFGPTLHQRLQEHLGRTLEELRRRAQQRSWSIDPRWLVPDHDLTTVEQLEQRLLVLQPQVHDLEHALQTLDRALAGQLAELERKRKAFETLFR
jgi:DNA-binding helix-hairpin-helix protein with protein kinase domain